MFFTDPCLTLLTFTRKDKLDPDLLGMAHDNSFLLSTHCVPENLQSFLLQFPVLVDEKDSSTSQVSPWETKTPGYAEICSWLPKQLARDRADKTVLNSKTTKRHASTLLNRLSKLLSREGLVLIKRDVCKDQSQTVPTEL